jgi:hypothetical protein
VSCGTVCLVPSKRRAKTLAKKPSQVATVPAHVRATMKWLSARGAKLGGIARWEGRTAAEKSAHARLMVAAREAKRKGKKG